MTPEEALNILDQAASMAPGNRRDHATIQQATAAMKRFIAENKKEDDGHG
jgi:hypothetical protein